MKDSIEKRMLSKIEDLDYIGMSDSKLKIKICELDYEIIKKRLIHLLNLI